MNIYLDYNATAPIDSRVIDTMVDVYRNYIGNPNSQTHDYGNNARKIVEEARGKVASLLGVHPDEIFFTSGSTESINISIQGLKDYAEATGKKHIITTAIEHKAVIETCRHMQSCGFTVDYIKPDQSGAVDAEKVLSLVRPDTLLVAVMHVNNETGVIQPVKEIGDRLADTGTMFLIDATQSCGKLVEEIRNLNYTMLSFSAHKFGGPQGVGVLVHRKKKYKLPPVKQIMYGGDQEHGIRPGTIPVALVAGLGKACELAEAEYKQEEKKNKEIKQDVLRILSESGLQYQINGDQKRCISSTINLCIDGITSEALMLATRQYLSISNGSACTSQSYDLSYVLTAMDLLPGRIEDSIRISWGKQSSKKDVHEGVAALTRIAKSLI